MNKIIIALTILVSSVAAQAQSNNFGEAGCGLGSIVMGKNDNQIIAATLNATGMQSFGITSGTSNCTDSGAVNSAQAVPVYIEVNKLALAKDAARGQGETLAGLAQLMGCDAKAFGTALKSNYNSIFVDTGMQPAAIQTQIVKASACGA
ncbi:MAG: DUF3015 family protein [Bdellovibrionota bacterium]